MEYTNRLHRLLKISILVVSMVLLLSVIPITETTEAENYEVYGWINDQSDKPIENVKVTLFDPDNGDIRIDMTNEWGEYSIDTPPGHYIIHYSHARYYTTSSPVQVNPPERNLWTIQLTRINEADANITGQVKDNEGNPGSDAYVYFMDTNAAHDGENLFGQTEPNTIMVEANENGNYNIDNAYVGDFDVVVRIGSSRYYYGAQTSVTLTEGANPALDIVYDDWGNDHTIYVKVFNSNDQKISNAEIILYDTVNNMWNSVTSSPGGVTVPNGTYDLIVRARGYRTHIEQIVVTDEKSIQVVLDDGQYTVTTTDITFNDWEDASYDSIIESQFDHGPFYRSNEFRLFNSGIIRYDIDRIFGNGDGTLNGIEAGAYQTFLNSIIGPDGDTTRTDFMVNDVEYTYEDFTVTFDAGTTDTKSNDTLDFVYSYDLTSDIEADTMYVVIYNMNVRALAVDESSIKEYTENAIVRLPAGFEVTYEKDCGSCYYTIEHAENDTNIVYINGTYQFGKYGNSEFHSRENDLPTPVIELSEDFMPGDETYLFKANEYIEFNASNSNDNYSPFGKIISYEWTFDDSTREVEKNFTAVAVRKFSEGTYDVTLKVTDNAGGSNEKNITLIIDGTPPNVDFSAEPEMVDQGSSENEKTRVFLNITTMDDLNGIFDEFSWDLGDGTINIVTELDERNITYYYPDLNITKLTGENENEYVYTINLTIWDKAGNENTATRDVKVNNTKRPSAVIYISDDLDSNDELNVYKTGENITFDASDSEGDGTEIIAYTWDFGDGTPDSDEKVVNHSYDQNGIYDVTLTVQDEFGATTTQNITIYIDDQAPTVFFDLVDGWMSEGWYFINQKNDTNTIEEYLLNLTANGTKDNGDVGDFLGLYEFSWDFGEPDKPFYQGQNMSAIDTPLEFTLLNNSAKNVSFDNNVTYHYYYTITLTVWDRAGNNGTYHRNVIVNDTEAPVAKFSYLEDVNEGTAMDLNATKTKDNIGIVNYTWIIEDPDGEFDNMTNAGVVENVTFAKDGDYSVTLIVKDARGNQDEHVSIISINLIPKPDISIDSDDILYSKDKITEGDTISILVEVTNDGEKEAWNVTAEFFFRKNLNDDEVPIGTFDFQGMLAPTEMRIANLTYKAEKSGQIVVRVNTTLATDPAGYPNEDGDLSNNEAFQDIYVEDKEDEVNWPWIIGVASIVIIIAAAVLIFAFKPELIGLRPASKTTKKSGKSKKK